LKISILKISSGLLFSPFLLLANNSNEFSLKLKEIMNGIENHRESIQDNKFNNIHCPFILEINSPAPQIEIEKKGQCNRFEMQTATKEQFMEISGIDRRLARVIVGYRNDIGFKKSDDLKKISGMNDIIFQAIVNKIRESENCFKELEDSKMAFEIQSNNSESIQKKSEIKTIIEDNNPMLEMIFDDRVKISDKWYRVGDEVGNNKIVEIGFDSIKLKAKGGDLKEIQISQVGKIKIESFLKPKNKKLKQNSLIDDN
jgi:hypothetical protein